MLAVLPKNACNVKFIIYFQYRSVTNNSTWLTDFLTGMRLIQYPLYLDRNGMYT